LWQRTRAGLAETVYSEDEKTALADLAAIGGLEDYVSAAHTALHAGLHAIETGSDPMHTVGNVKAWHTVASYERALEAGTLDDAPNLVRQAEDVLAAESGESAGIGKDFEPQEIPESVRQDTEARRAAYAGVTGDGTA
jgi:hypothetical protein